MQLASSVSSYMPLAISYTTPVFHFLPQSLMMACCCFCSAETHQVQLAVLLKSSLVIQAVWVSLKRPKRFGKWSDVRGDKVRSVP
ncbi:hypothetical protein M440DRAFT_173420 [Trichoderma longibrachiatum ATCC 18648]|uniref:Uncharacterized protein n=1 Tax=Trichoderma longibrachiatum ATCC 18648 TaxID=983965 RepID=A0A2T4CE60_TRILO|nr:hypothetical protein M440DRAFT_173420 [Trichoderma longibrachiatum ATCC 18648]